MTVNIKIFQIGLDPGSEYDIQAKEILAVYPFEEHDNKKAILIGKV